jgi:leucyl aminopeptidase
MVVSAHDWATADTVAVLVGQPEDGYVDERLSGVARTGELSSDLGETIVLHDGGRRLVAVGIGNRDEVDHDALRTAGAAIAAALSRVGGALSLTLDGRLGLPVAEEAAALVEGVVLGSYTPGHWKTQQGQSQRPIERIVLDRDDAVASAGRAVLLAERTNRARDLVNMPPNELTPQALAEAAEALAGNHDCLTVRTLGPTEMAELGMGAIAAVGRGSHNEPRLIALSYDPPLTTDSDVVLGFVGKAITFDAGGISLKPAKGMELMKGDMAGGASVLHAIGAIAALGLPVRVLGVLAAAENLPSGHAFRPGDILRAANGTTIEITNTDYEGRLVLADALWYARRKGATHVIDLATLTGAMKLALGDIYAGFFANDDAWRARILAAGQRSGDLVWPFPLHRRYRRYVDSTFADMKNTSDFGEAAPALGAEFLREFAGEGPWAHVDMLGPSFLERPRGDYYRVPGGTGYGVRLLVELATSFA